MRAALGDNEPRMASDAQTNRCRDDQDELFADFTQYTDIDADSISKYVRRRIEVGERALVSTQIEEVAICRQERLMGGGYQRVNF